MDVLDFVYLNGEKKIDPLPKTDVKTDVSGYYKTPAGAIVSKDIDSLKAYKLRKMKSNQINNLEKDVSELKKDISEIKELLRGISIGHR